VPDVGDFPLGPVDPLHDKNFSPLSLYRRSLLVGSVQFETNVFPAGSGVVAGRFVVFRGRTVGEAFTRGVCYGICELDCRFQKHSALSFSPEDCQE